MRLSDLILPAALVAVALPAAAQSRPSSGRYALVPWPASVTSADGVFAVDAAVRIRASDSTVVAIAELLASVIGDASGIAPRVVVGDDRAALEAAIEVRLDQTAGSGLESYRLDVTPARVLLVAPAPAGLFLGVQTLRQLTTSAGIAAVSIRDEPRFRYRGLHLDVGRHVFPVEFIKRYIDVLAMYKLNRFHWHLTEDQGWRIEIRQYPRLTEVGAFRNETVVGHGGWDTPLQYDGQRYGGYCTQAEIREVVAYAKERFITIIPEIELPGHSVAALAAYPELACTPGPFDVLTKWGISDDIYCPHEATFEFLENVLTEVMQLFPGEYIHIGGDEAPKRRWAQSAVAQQVIAREGLANEYELQSWFIRRVERFLNAHGRKLIGWDEIMEGGLSPTATMMFWRNWATVPVGPDSTRVSAAKVAASRGNDIIMTPNNTLYLDHWQADPVGEPLAIGGYSTLRHVYEFDPVPADFTPAEAARVIGAQGNVWTEYMKTSQHVEYMVFPRMFALAEVVWSPKSARNWASFTQRLPAQLARLDALGVNYRRPDPPTLAVEAPAVAPAPRVIGYLASWGVRTKGLRIPSIAGDRLSHIFYAFGRVTEDGVAALGDPCLDVGECADSAARGNRPPGGNFGELRLLKQRYPHLKLVISLGGWTGSKWFSDAAATADGRRRLAASTINVFLRAHPGLFDGIDIDWEFPVEGGLPENTARPSDRRNFTLLMEEYRRQLDELGVATGVHYELAIAASARPREIANLELSQLARSLDFINVMTYDYHGSGPVAHLNAPLRAVSNDPTPTLNVASSMQIFLDAGVPAQKLVVGAPFYARGFGNVDPTANGLLQRGDPEAAGDWRTVDWRVLVRRRPAENGFVRYWNDEAQVPWLYNPATRVFISYDGPDGVRAKTDYVRTNGFGGIMFWELGGDDGTLLRTIHETLARGRGGI